MRSAISAGREAAKVASTPAEKKAEEKAIAASFEMFDKDGSGEIDMQELRSVSQELGVPMSEEDLEQAMGEMDKDGSGKSRAIHMFFRLATLCTVQIVLDFRSCSWSGSRLTSIGCVVWGQARWMSRSLESGTRA